tara:strand:- start:484 stop:915 length:432 start_codon:yes stop_codon:yes gene_type:complete
MSNALSTLDFATLTVLSKAVAAAQKANRKATEAGEYTVDEQVTVDVAGSIKVGEDYEQRIVLKADPFKMLVVALSHLNGVTVDSIVREALDLDDDALVKSVKAEAKAAWEAINRTTKTDCKGKVTVAKGSTATVGTVGLKVNG